MAQLIHYHMSETLHYSKITGMDNSGILFGEEESIFFQECAQNFARFYPESSGRCVAERNISAQPPYFEFYTCGKSMIVVFDELGKNTHKAFHEFQEKLESYGYTTYDLT